MLPKLKYFLFHTRVRLPRVSLEVKIIVLLLGISLIPLAFTDLIWFTTARNQVLKNSSNDLAYFTSNTSNQINSFITLKQVSLIIHSQTPAVINLNVPTATPELQYFFLQDQDLSKIVLLDSSGKELIKMERDKIYPSNELVDESANPEFKVPTFAGGEVYISPLQYDDKNKDPEIAISVPIVIPNSGQNLQDLNTSSIGRSRKPGEIKGVLIADFNLAGFWKQIANLQIENGGYVFIVDDKGNVIDYPSSQVLPSNNLRSMYEVDHFLTTITNPDQNSLTTVSQSVNEFGWQALTTHALVKSTNWGIITEIPLTAALNSTNQLSIFALILLLIVLSVVIIMSLWSSNQLIHPILILQQGVGLFGKGQLSSNIQIHTGDEIEDLAHAFNNMADSLKRSIREISAERNKLSIILSGINDAVIALDLNQNIVTFNKAAQELTGYSDRAVIGKKIGDIIKFFENNKEIPVQTYFPINTGSFEGIVFNKMNINLVTIQKQTAVNLLVGKISEGNSVNLGCIITLHNITRERQLEEMKLDFVSMAVHELRTPLTSLKGYLYIFLRDYKSSLNEDGSMLLNRVNISTQRILSLVENLLNVTRIEHKALKLHTQPIDWVENLQSIIDEIIDQAKDKKQELIFEKPKESLPPVNADKFRINEVITNLLSNAINYTPSGGKITAWTERQGNEVITHIKDNGEGIPADAIPHLFTKFFRVSGKLEEGSKGTGLGLYITKSIIDMHHGRIWVDSIYGKGSTFSFALPIN